jgi:hypothetical protein
MRINSYAGLLDANELNGIIGVVGTSDLDAGAKFEILWNVYQLLLDIFGEDAPREITARFEEHPGSRFDDDFDCLKHHKRMANKLSRHKKIALGGTFDRLHYGHKALLSLGCLLATECLIVGVTSIYHNTN